MSAIDRLNGSLSSVAIKAPVQAATTASIVLAGLQTVDGVALAQEDRVLVKNQGDALENGIWIAQGAAWRRASDFNGSRDAVSGTQVGVVAGNVNGGQRFQLGTADPVTIGVSPLGFVLMGQGPAGATGPQGPAGITGATGPQGPAGASGSGTGDVLGPEASTIGNIATWAGISGDTLSDGAIAAVDLARLSGNQTVTGNKVFSGSVTANGGLVMGGASNLVRSGDGGSSPGPSFVLWRDSASPAAADNLGVIGFRGKDSGGNDADYVQLGASIVGPSDGAEAGGFHLDTMVGGVATRQLAGQAGIVLGGATGGFPGTGKINAAGFYLNGVEIGGAGVPTGTGALWFLADPPTGWLICNGQAVSRSTYAALFALLGTAYGAGDGSTTFALPDLRGRFAIGSGGSSAQSATISAANVNDQLTVTAHGFIDGQKLRYAVSGGSAIAGLSNNTDYYAIVVNANTLKLANSTANALAGSAMNVTSSSMSGTHTLSYNLTSRTLGGKGGVEDHVLSVAEMPAHSHDIVGVSGEAGGSALLLSSNVASTSPGTSTGGSAAHNNMPPFLGVHFIVKV